MARLQPTRSSSSSNFSGFIETFGSELTLSADGSLLAYSVSRRSMDFGLSVDNREDGILIQGAEDALLGVPCVPTFPTCGGSYISSSRADLGEFGIVTRDQDTIVDFGGVSQTVVGPVEREGRPAATAVVAPDLSADGTTLAFARDGQIVVVDLPAGANATPWIASTDQPAPLALAQGGGGSGASSSPFLSADGRSVTFVTDAPDLLSAAGKAGPGKGGKAPQGNVDGVQILLKDLDTGSLSLVSADRRGEPGNGPSDHPEMSRDGRLVAFTSEAGNLVARDANGVADVFVKDLKSGRVTLLSADRRKVPGNGSSGEPSLALDGRFVAFSSTADNLVQGDLNGASDVFVADAKNGRIRLASVDADGDQIGGSGPSISGDGRYVVFLSDVAGFPNGDGTVTANAFVKDMMTGALVRLDTGAVIPVPNTILDVTLFSVEISADGAIIAFYEGSRQLNIAPDVSENDAPAVGEAISRVFEDDPAFSSRETIGVTTNPLLDVDEEALLLLQDDALDLARLLPGARGLSAGTTEALTLVDGGAAAPALTIDLPLLL